MPDLQVLIEALADIAVADYLREAAANDAGDAGPQENPVLPPAREAA